MIRIAHVTHEAVEQKGGIGTVLKGLLTSRAYHKKVERTVLVGPLLTLDSAEARLGEHGKAIYSSLDGRLGGPHAGDFREIEARHSVRLIHGSRALSHPETGEENSVEIILIDARDSIPEQVNLFKFRLWERFGIDSTGSELVPELEQFIRIAEPAYEVIRLLLGEAGENFLVSHDFMGIHTALKFILEGDRSVRTVFHAHEVATARHLTESRLGHDTMFYRVLRSALAEGRYLDEVFGSQHTYWKHGLFRAVHNFDAIFAVGDQIVEELRFLGAEFRNKPIDCVYNGLPSARISLEERLHSREMLQDYAQGVTGTRPDFVFTHVARPVPSKAFWRDFQVLLRLDPLLRQAGRTATHFLLASEASAVRAPDLVEEMEKAHEWPSHHCLGWPDLTGPEIGVNDAVETFNLVATNIRAVLVNQFGWSRSLCGSKMPPSMEFRDLRRGTDVEFGLSLYEPFGIAQLEPLTYGAICIISSECGCRGALEGIGGADAIGILVGDYAQRSQASGSVDECLAIGRRQRDRVETAEAERLAAELCRRLTDDPGQLEKRLEIGFDLASRMNWETVTREQFLPGLFRINR